MGHLMIMMINRKDVFHSKSGTPPVKNHVFYHHKYNNRTIVTHVGLSECDFSNVACVNKFVDSTMVSKQYQSCLSASFPLLFHYCSQL